MPLTDGTRVETIEEGGGDEEVSIETSIDYYFSLLTAAKDVLKDLQRTIGKVDADLTKFRARLEDWLEFQEVTWDGAGGPRGPATSKSGRQISLLPPTLINRTSTQGRDGALAGPSGDARNAARPEPKGKNNAQDAKTPARDVAPAGRNGKQGRSR